MCKILDAGASVQHFGYALGGGVYVHREENGDVAICRHPGDNVRAVPDVAITLTSDQWEEATEKADSVPEHPAAIAERELKASERKAREQAKRDEAKAKKPKAKRSARVTPVAEPESTPAE